MLYLWYAILITSIAFFPSGLFFEPGSSQIALTVSDCHFGDDAANLNPQALIAALTPLANLLCL